MDLHLKNLHKNFGSFPALVDVSLDVASGELIALVGPSGSGKTTLLRMIAGLEFPDYGQILFGSQDMARTRVAERRIGFVFQHYALFKHMTIADNIAFGLKVRPRALRPAPEAIRHKAGELLDLVQLAGLGERYPHQLSGGQKQRVALARALAIDPRVLLLDEPFGALDAKVRKELRRWLRELHDRTGYTTVFVTHDQEEAMELADRVVIMNRGRIEQQGSVADVYERAATPFVFDFLGGTNVIAAEVRARGVFVGGQEIAPLGDRIHPPGPADVYVRPGDLRLADGEHPGLPVTVASVQRLGPLVRVGVRHAGGEAPLTVELPHLHHDVPQFQPGAVLRLRLMHFSLYAHQAPAAPARALEAPVLIGRERARGRLG